MPEFVYARYFKVFFLVVLLEALVGFLVLLILEAHFQMPLNLRMDNLDSIVFRKSFINLKNPHNSALEFSLLRFKDITLPPSPSPPKRLNKLY